MYCMTHDCVHHDGQDTVRVYEGCGSVSYRMLATPECSLTGDRLAVRLAQATSEYDRRVIRAEERAL